MPILQEIRAESWTPQKLTEDLALPASPVPKPRTMTPVKTKIASEVKEAEKVEDRVSPSVAVEAVRKRIMEASSSSFKTPKNTPSRIPSNFILLLVLVSKVSLQKSPSEACPLFLESASATPSSTTASASRGRIFKLQNAVNASTPSYARPTTASKLRSSPRKRDVQLSPAHGLYQQRKVDLDVTPCPRSGFQPESKYTSSLKRDLPASVDMQKIISPVAQYIRSNPVPPLVHQIRPKATKHFEDEVEMQQERLDMRTPPVESEANGTPGFKRMFAPLPVADYRSSRVALEQQLPTEAEPKLLPKAFGTTNTVEAKVYK